MFWSGNEEGRGREERGFDTHRRRNVSVSHTAWVGRQDGDYAASRATDGRGLERNGLRARWNAVHV